MFDVKAIWDMLKGQSSLNIAKISAYVLVPGLVLGFAISGLSADGLALDPQGYVAISELKTETLGKGAPKSKRGVAIFVEPGSSEYRIPLGPSASRIWSSLDEEAARANSDRLVL